MGKKKGSIRSPTMLFPSFPLIMSVLILLLSLLLFEVSQTTEGIIDSPGSVSGNLELFSSHYEYKPQTIINIFTKVRPSDYSFPF